MEIKKRKKYVKPKVTRIKLDAKCAVLGGCKIAGEEGPMTTGCGSPLACATHAS
jgi:hypothetical protein